jgi:hypothetical protein
LLLQLLLKVMLPQLLLLLKVMLPQLLLLAQMIRRTRRSK